MRWRGRERSDNVRDQRGMTPRRMAAGGGIGTLVVVVIAMLFGADPAKFLQLQQQQQAAQQQQAGNGDVGKDDDAREFVSVVVRDTEQVWDRLFRGRRLQYKQPVVNLFSGEVVSGCGRASSAMGPFYCPADQQIYLDPTFFEELARRHDAPGDFAQAYVIAHEVGHHVQNLLGFNERANRARRSGDERRANQESVRLELQADFLAGVWAHHAHKRFNILESGDIQEAMNAAIQIGDDTLQAKARGKVVPSAFTHGTGDQRRRWFMQGLETGNFELASRLFEVPYDKL